MGDCCDHKSQELSKISKSHTPVLRAVLWINLVMFFVEMGVAKKVAYSTALFADSLDMLGDAFVYAMSLYVLGRGQKLNAFVSLVKGIVMMILGLGVMTEAIYRYSSPILPVANWMVATGSLAFIANLTCSLLLLKFRNEDLNMRSTWLCTRNDVISNLGVIVAAALVALTHTRYPDLVVGTVVAILVLQSAYSVIRESLRTLKHPVASR